MNNCFNDYFHVSLEGTDNLDCGEIENPCNTIQYTIDNIVDSTDLYSTIILNNGTYYENLNIQNAPLRIASNFIFTSDSNDVNTTILKMRNFRIYNNRKS